ncbi:GAF domain-containing protein [Ciceribacter sp. L1K23]|uniref:GAF domain-containing protein n=1 Tax=Ciceribacter sp. L1K23 TaxID=2820276 RepID=UPI001B81D873|nr:GAF domain-containing protein [Ciceribacter sp. L1K23]MBR0556411.1 GAF domain-containing protein [Ciceribacter sp. L1K23]
MIPLSTIRDSFEGVIPSIIATTDRYGVPNVSYLSHVYYVDEQHVALSNQFFSKTADNVAANGLATVMVVDGLTGQQHILDLVFSGSEDSGRIFNQVERHLALLEQGMSHVMKLKAVDIYRVEDCRPVPAAHPLELPSQLEAGRDHISQTARLTQCLSEESDPEKLLDCALEGLEELFGFRHSMVLVPDESRSRLTTIASRGYEQFGFGSEIAFGDGVIGLAAKAMEPVRVTDFSRGRRYVAAVRAMSGSEGGVHIPLPALPAPLSQLAVPMLAQGRLIGVLFTESEKAFTFRHADEQSLRVIAAQLALSLSYAMNERERHEPETAHAAPSAPIHAGGKSVVALRFYPRDASLFVDGEYLIRGVPGRLLWHMLEQYATSGRQDFLNREIRRDKSLQLPDFKDNLETRLILLRRRLDEKGGPIRLTRPERGRMRLEVDGLPELQVVDT